MIRRNFESSSRCEFVACVQRRRVARAAACFFEHLLTARGLLVWTIRIGRRLQRIYVQRECVEMFVPVSGPQFGIERFPVRRESTAQRGRTETTIVGDL